MVRIVGNRDAALQQLQTIIENRALTCVENVVRLEVVIVPCSVMVRQSIWPLESAAVVSAKPVLLLLGLTAMMAPGHLGPGLTVGLTGWNAFVVICRLDLEMAHTASPAMGAVTS